MVSDAQKKASAKWDKENMIVVGTKLKRSYAADFRTACEAVGTTPSSVLRNAIDEFMLTYAKQEPHTAGNAAPSPHSAPKEIPGEMQSAMDVLKASAAAQIAGVPDEVRGPVTQPDDDTEARRAALLESIKRL